MIKVIIYIAIMVAPIVILYITALIILIREEMK